jgi:tetratricopeptide (TPR) repeat protein
VETLSNSGLSIQELAAELNVQYLLMGSVQKYGDNIRLTLLLMDENGRQLWSEEYDEEFNLPEKYFSLQSRIARQVAAAVNATIMPEELQKIERTTTTSLRALGLYRKGREEYVAYFSDNANVEALRSAAFYYRSALEADPAYGQAYAGLALALQNLYEEESMMNKDISENGISLHRDTILPLADLALSFDPYLEEAYLVKGNYFLMINDFNRAQDEFNKALQINPNFSLAYNAISDMLIYQKDNWIGGLEHKLKAIELERGGDMQAKLLSELGDFYEIMGFPDRAREIYAHILNLTGDSAKYFFDMAGPAYCEQNWQEQISWFRRSLELDSTQPWPLMAMSDAYRSLGNNDSACYFTSRLLAKGELGTQGGFSELNIYQLLLEEGQIDSANQELDKLEEYLLDQIDSNIGSKDYIMANLINAYCLRNKCDKAMEYLKQLDIHPLHPLYVIIEIENLPDSCNFGEDPEYQRILTTLKTAWAAEHERVRQWLEENDM